MKDSDLYQPHCRNADIVADAAVAILSRDARNFTGNFLEDETFLREELGITDFSKYQVTDPNRF